MLLSGWAGRSTTAICAWIMALVIRLDRRRAAHDCLENRGVRLGNAYVEFFRNMPLLVQLFLWYFVLPELLPKAWGLWIKQMPPRAVLHGGVGLGLFMSARVAEQVRAGIQSLPRGQGHGRAPRSG